MGISNGNDGQIEQIAIKDVKNDILKAAKSLFATKGFEGTTVRQLCDKAGVSLALVSYHFGGKDNVFYALFEPLDRNFKNMTYDLTVAEKALRDFIRSFVIYRYEEPELIHILQQELMMRSPRLDKLKNVILPSWQQLRSILEAGKLEGTIQFDSVQFAVNFVMGTLIFSLNDSFLNPSESDQDITSEQAAGLVIRFVFNGLNPTVIK
ncbi:TetR/AcrR family transcriptional regulator [Cohnella mopanensis]|uniref:TetR/AcrR family transcriptional regulator n=1 Tax=Cohnella mopanensis TaxID=2911966 RepID=UPI001EF84922|nr:TetR/AcrR family transcriptional regulator [Cohnella mopanensis]